jgi:ubiquinol-cytochrome c reductase cytochrome b subunit
VSDARPLPRVEVWQEDDEAWRWRYLDAVEEDGEPLELPANEPEPSQEEAVSAARLAYPGVPVVLLTEDEAEPETDRRTRHRRWQLIVGVVLVVAVAVRLLRRDRAGAT